MMMEIDRREVSQEYIAAFELPDFLNNISRIIETEIILCQDDISKRSNSIFLIYNFSLGRKGGLLVEVRILYLV